ncbi:MAG: 23S rRNA (uracil(1939)-C(5))-methyltransferase RlmD [Clostridia bacterium]|nr:23S rRNA (uracil(1939)-C(5))-methyltransferase RlmD [Clostridia bacterium]
MKKNDILTLNIEKTSSDGRGIGYVDGKICFVLGTLEGETVEAKIYTVHNSYLTAGATKIITPSPKRQYDYCDASGVCGGCPLSHIKYEHQLSIKRTHVVDTLSRIGGIKDADSLVTDTLGMEYPFNYRNKMVFPISEKNGKVVGGFYAPKSHEVVGLNSCCVGEPCAACVLSCVVDFMNENNVMPYDEKKHKGTIRRVFVRTGFNNREAMVVISSASEKIKNLALLTEKIKKLYFGVYKLKSIILNINKNKNNLVLGDKNITLWGKDAISDSILGLYFSISPHSFYQVNPVQTETLYMKALELAAIDKTKTVLDVYCGIGTISLCAAASAKKVIGVEIVDAAIRDAEQNADRNNIKNAEFFCGAAEDVVPTLLGQDIKPDVVILDPPRKGSDEKTLSAIVNASPERIVYVSCNPATLARDVKFLEENGYKLKSATTVDMFPNTEHVECCVLLYRE